VSGEYTYDYAIIRVVPRVDRGELINVGVIVSCPAVDFLEARIELDASRLSALDATLDLEATRANLDTIPVVCRGGEAAGPIGLLPQRSRFHWLVSPRSTIIQFSPVHTGRTGDPGTALEHLLDTMVRRAPASQPRGAGH
jgi:Protein of unknown function (DUF3037)